MAFTKAQLRAELLTDAGGLGYAPYVTANNDTTLADLLNDRTKGGNIDRVRVTAAELQSCVVASEALALTTAQSNLWVALLTAAADGGILLSDNQIRNQILAVFTASGAGTTRSKVSTLQQRAGSRAEALWGEGTTVSYADVGVALRNV